MMKPSDENFEQTYTEESHTPVAGAGSMADEATAGINDSDDGAGIGRTSYAESPGSFCTYYGDVC